MRMRKGRDEQVVFVRSVDVDRFGLVADGQKTEHGQVKVALLNEFGHVGPCDMHPRRLSA